MLRRGTLLPRHLSLFCLIALVSLSAEATAGLIVPEYSSLPGATHTLYVNFGGLDYPGTWQGLSPGHVPAYNIDGNASTFSATELSNIQQMWARVAEAYSPFNVNVTTVAPGTVPVAGQWAQIVVDSGNNWDGVSGGVTWRDGFTSGGQERGTGWVFADYNGNGNVAYTAESVAHEAGHLFGLIHQSQWTQDRPNHWVEVAEYRPSLDGGLTAPLMGEGRYAIRGLWSNGTSNSPTVNQWDRTIILSSLGYRPDDGNSTIGLAKPLVISNGTQVSAAGVIKEPTENDFYSFTTGAGQVTISILRNSAAGMLDAKLLLYGQDGTLLQSIDPSLSLSGPDYGLNATFTGTLAAGTYYLDVTSHGDYGDVGQYTVTGSLMAVPEPATIALFVVALASWLAAKRRGVASAS